MRKSRSAACALGVLLAAAPMTMTGPAASAPPDERQPSPRFEMAAAPSPPLGFVGPRRRTIFSEVVDVRGRLVLRGDVQDYPRRLVVVQRKKCYDCGWRRHELVRTGLGGRFHSTIAVPKRGSTYWRAKVRATNRYVRSYSATWETYY